jgi:5-methylcytosine-specific restriction endonuclease McrA
VSSGRGRELDRDRERAERLIRLRGTATSKPRFDTRKPGDTVPISIGTRLFVWQRAGGRCRHCGSREDLHLAHVIPRSWGGASTVENVQLLCRNCNFHKGASLVDGGSA